MSLSLAPRLKWETHSAQRQSQPHSWSQSATQRFWSIIDRLWRNNIPSLTKHPPHLIPFCSLWLGSSLPLYCISVLVVLVVFIQAPVAMSSRGRRGPKPNRAKARTKAAAKPSKVDAASSNGGKPSG